MALFFLYQFSPPFTFIGALLESEAIKANSPPTCKQEGVSLQILDEVFDMLDEFRLPFKIDKRDDVSIEKMLKKTSPDIKKLPHLATREKK